MAGWETPPRLTPQKDSLWDPSRHSPWWPGNIIFLKDIGKTFEEFIPPITGRHQGAKAKIWLSPPKYNLWLPMLKHIILRYYQLEPYIHSVTFSVQQIFTSTIRIGNNWRLTAPHEEYNVYFFFIGQHIESCHLTNDSILNHTSNLGNWKFRLRQRPILKFRPCQRECQRWKNIYVRT